MAAVALPAALLAGACTAPPPAAPPFDAVVDVHGVMNAVADPAADVIWDAVGFIVTAEGEVEKRPRTDEEWTLVANAAVVVAETGNLLMMPPRAVDDGEWMRSAAALVRTGRKALAAAEAQDPVALFDAGGDIYVACASCHTKYMTEAADKAAETTGTDGVAAAGDAAGPTADVAADAGDR